jgi:phage terminase small subunit
VNPKQKRFAEEYAVDHNATAAAIRAGYAEGRAKQTGSEMLAKPDVAQLVAKLDAEKADDLGLEAREALDRVVHAYERAIEEQPKIWKGQPVTYLDEGGEIRVVTEFRAGSVAARMAELLFKKAGFDVSRTAVESAEAVVYTLHLDRDLSKEDDQ